MDTSLYANEIMDWAENRDHLGTLEHPQAEATLSNPLCGDRVCVQVRLEEGLIRELRYQVKGCILCRAACAHLASLAPGLNLEGLSRLREEFTCALSGAVPELPPTHAAFRPVLTRKSRHGCVRLPYDALFEALRDEG